jgi:hypothetical protein
VQHFDLLGETLEAANKAVLENAEKGARHNVNFRWNPVI